LTNKGKMKRGVLILILFSFGLATMAQDEENKSGFQKEKLFVGGSFGVVFGTNTLVNISPQVGYRFSKFFAAGMGINTQYASYQEPDLYGNPYLKTSEGILGLNIFGRFYPVDFLMLQVQPEGNYRFGKIKFYNPDQTTKLDAEIIPSILAGGGVVLPAGKGSFTISVMYDILQSKNSLYGNQPFVNLNYSISIY
jgi:hypothetical protein